MTRGAGLLLVLDGCASRQVCALAIRPRGGGVHGVCRCGLLKSACDVDRCVLKRGRARLRRSGDDAGSKSSTWAVCERFVALLEEVVSRVEEFVLVDGAVDGSI